MKTQNENLRICTICNRREFDKKTGLFCSQTKEKPAFDTQCNVLAFFFYLIIGGGIVDGNISGWVGAILLGSLLIALLSITLIAVETRNKSGK